MPLFPPVMTATFPSSFPMVCQPFPRPSNQLRREPNRRRRKRLRDRALFFCPLGESLELLGFDPWNARFDLERDRLDRKAVVHFREIDVRGDAKLGRRVPHSSQAEGKRHRVTTRVRSAEQLLGVGPRLAVFAQDARSERIRLSAKRAALRGQLSVPVQHIAPPYCSALPNNLLLLRWVTPRRAQPWTPWFFRASRPITALATIGNKTFHSQSETNQVRVPASL